MNNAHEPDPNGDPEAPESVEQLAETGELPVPEPETEPDDGLHTPGEWAALLMPAGKRGQQHTDLWKHGAASALHGWDSFEHNNGTPLRLSQEDYEAALDAATAVQSDGSYIPHEGAVGRAKGA